MSLKEYDMIKDVRETPLALDSVVRHVDRLERLADSGCGFKKFFFIGCGSSYYAALYGSWPLMKSDKVSVYALPSSELFLHFKNILDEESFVVGVSRSGKTAETVSALEECKKRGAYTVGFTIEKENRISNTVDELLVLEVGGEKSIIMTKSFTSLSLATALLSTILNEKISGVKERLLEERGRLPSLAERLLSKEDKIIAVSNRLVAENVERFVFLGSGPSYPVALEGALKVKETSYAAAEGLHLLEFRHGPMASVGEKQMLVLSCFLEENNVYLKNFVSEFVDRHADLLLITDSSELGENSIEVPSEYGAESKALLSIVPMQILAYYYAVGRGRNPDRPRNLSRYIQRF